MASKRSLPSFDNENKSFDISNDEQITTSTHKQKIGAYLVDCTIGKGNFSIVKLATHTITQMKVAIKIIDKNKLSGNNLKNMYREVHILKKLRHKNIIQLFQIMESEKLLYIVMEYASRGELFELIASRGKLSEKEACSKMIEIVSAVQYCHVNNIVHRDIKSENILFDSFGTIKLTDFGFGNIYKDGQNLSTYCGSPPYAAPEIFMGVAYDGKKADIWSLGILLYVIVCGSLPFDAPSLKLLKEQILHGRYRVPFWMSHECEDLLKRMLAKTPDQRPSIDQLYSHKWFLKFAPELLLKSSTIINNSNELKDTDDHFHELALKVLEKSGMPRDTVLDSVRREAYDHIMATYLLLVDKLRLCAKDTHGEYWWLSQWDLYHRRRHSAAVSSSRTISDESGGGGGASVNLSHAERRRCSELTPRSSDTSSLASDMIKQVVMTHYPKETSSTVNTVSTASSSLPQSSPISPIENNLSNNKNQNQCDIETEEFNSSTLPSSLQVGVDDVVCHPVISSQRSSMSAESGIGQSESSDSRRQSSARSSLSCASATPWRMSIPCPQLCTHGMENLSIDEGMEEMSMPVEEENDADVDDDDDNDIDIDESTTMASHLHRTPECDNINACSQGDHNPMSSTRSGRNDDATAGVASSSSSSANVGSNAVGPLPPHAPPLPASSSHHHSPSIDVCQQLNVPLVKDIRRNSDSGVVNNIAIIQVASNKLASALEDNSIGSSSTRKLGETGRVGGIFFKLTSTPPDENDCETEEIDKTS